MSSNHHSPMITRDNYEELFLLYVDDELTAEQKKAVDAFVLLHPDLKAELDLLCSTKLPAEDFTFEGKAELLADSMKVNAVDESLLLYIDNELPQTEAAKVAAQLKQDEAMKLQHQLLLKTKLDQTEHIPYPNKKELYRHTERRIAPVWLRVAAAVAVLVSGTAVWMNMSPSKSSDNGVAVATTPKATTQQPSNVTKQPETRTGNENTNRVATIEKSVLAPKENSVAVKTTPKHAEKATKQSTFSKPHTVVDEAVAAKTNNLPEVKKAIAPNVQPNAIAQANPKEINNPAVTSKVAPTYVSINAAAQTTVPVNAVANTDNERESGGMKTLLRKATRFIEKRTGIKAVNDDDELLAGPVAVKL